jgi:hypothetical protein
LLFALLGPALSLAEDAPAAAGARNNYRVEIIIFRQTQPPTSSEDYSAPVGNRGFGDKRDVSTGLPMVVRLLTDSELQMNGIAAQMAASSGVRVLAHAGWIQTATNWGRHAGLPLDQFGINVPDLKGKLYLERGDLLHFGAYLELGSAPTYTLSELRKVRYNEKHYIDHPAFGVIVQVSPTR